MSGEKISDMTDSLTVFPDTAYVPFVVTTNTGGLITTSNYRYNAGLYLAKLATLAANGGAALIGTSDSITVQAALTARPTSAALAAAGGAALIGHTGPITGETLQTQADIDNQLALSFERFGGGPNASASANNAAWLLMMAALDGAEAGEIDLYDGTYSISAALTFPTFARNITIRGRGPGRSFIRQTGANVNGITLPNGLNINVSIRDLTLQGAGSGTSYSGTGIGIFQSDTPGNDSYGIHLDNVWIANWGGAATFLPYIFSSDFREVHLNYCGNGFSVAGNTLAFYGCYPHNLPETGAVAYKITSGSAAFIGCNGVDDCDVCYQVGTSTADGDASDQFANITLIDCNVEDFNTIGVDVRNGTLRSFGTPYLGRASTANLQAIRTRTTSSISVLDNANSFVLKSGASWLNSRAVHALGGSIPFSSIGGGTTPLVFTYYDDAATSDATCPTDALYTVSSNTYGRLYNNVKATGQLVSAGTLGFVTGAGGAVTQQTDKSTAVELNKSCGAITMNNATLNAATSVSFTLTNNLIAATDTVTVNIKSGATANSYAVTVDAVAAGSCRIQLRNISAGNLGEALVLNFTVTKGAAA